MAGKAGGASVDGGVAGGGGGGARLRVVQGDGLVAERGDFGPPANSATHGGGGGSAADTTARDSFVCC